MFDVIEVRSHTKKFRTSYSTAQAARNAVRHLRRSEPGKRFTARRPDGTYLMSPR